MSRMWKRCLCLVMGGLLLLQTCLPADAYSSDYIRSAYQNFDGTYTEEQKQMAKNWLSAHGYPPTMDGAYAAYDDWLDGMWWDEIGSPAEIFGYDDEEEEPTAARQNDEPETRSEEEAPTAATQKDDSDLEREQEEELPVVEESGEGLLEEIDPEADGDGFFGIFWLLNDQQIRILWDVQKYLPWLIPLLKRLASYFPSLGWARIF